MPLKSPFFYCKYSFTIWHFVMDDPVHSHFGNELTRYFSIDRSRMTHQRKWFLCMPAAKTLVFSITSKLLWHRFVVRRYPAAISNAPTRSSYVISTKILPTYILTDTKEMLIREWFEFQENYLHGYILWQNIEIIVDHNIADCSILLAKL